MSHHALAGVGGGPRGAPWAEDGQGIELAVPPSMGGPSHAKGVAPSWLPRTSSDYAALSIDQKAEVDAWIKLAQDIAMDEIESAPSTRERERRSMAMHADVLGEWGAAELGLGAGGFFASHVRMLREVIARGGGILPADGITAPADSARRLQAYEDRAVGGGAAASFVAARPAMFQGLDPELIDSAFDVLLGMSNPASTAVGTGLIEGYKWVLVTMGARGVAAFSMRVLDNESYAEATGMDVLRALEKRVMRLQWIRPTSPVPPEETVSVTGAGDCLAAALVTGIAGGGGIARSLALGMAAGAHAVRSADAVPADLSIRSVSREARDRIWRSNQGSLSFVRGEW